VDPVKCVKCGGEMKLVAVILDDRELDRILAHQGWPTEFPKTKASRAPPVRAESGGDSSQVDARASERASLSTEKAAKRASSPRGEPRGLTCADWRALSRYAG
jgi:hypothetical protein